MSIEMWIIAVIRLVGALPVLRWPFYGGLLAIAVDQSDLFLMNLIDLGGVSDYQTFDKYLDQAYLFAFLIVAWRWEGFVRTIAIALYGYRLIGFAAFETLQDRDILLFFPNLFEFWFLLIAGLMHFGRLPRFTSPERITAAIGAQPAAPLQSDRRGDAGIVGRDRATRYIPTHGLALICLPLIALKVFQEYAIHYARWLDSFTAVEAVEAAWRWLSQPFT
ncbi:MAG: hypothetical protein GEU75_16210 [Dehalococcoidia bacterium]|nr:hypothetical protein [Dehalococcoidia bacterium]